MLIHAKVSTLSLSKGEPVRSGSSPCPPKSDDAIKVPKQSQGEDPVRHGVHVAGDRPVPVFQKVAGESQQARPERGADRSEEHTSELQSLMRISYAVFCLKKK